MATPRICSVEGCSKPLSAKGFCIGHYSRDKRHGDPLFGGSFKRRAPNGAAAAWLYGHVEHEDIQCLLWPFSRDGNGYGGIFHNGRDDRAHAVMCSLVNGPRPSRKHHAAHSCGRGHDGCVHPKHLRWATPTENVADKIIHGTQPMGVEIWNARLTEDDVRWMRRNVGHISYAEMGRQKGVAIETVRAAVSRKTWKHV